MNTIGTTMDTGSSRSATLQAELARHGLTDGDLRSEALAMAPAASAVIVTGSLAAGHGNAHSDIDLVCIVPDGQFSKLPIMVYKGEAKIDSEYWLLPDLHAAMARVSGADMLAAAGDVHEWKKLTRAIQSLIKLSIAHVLHADAAAQALLDYVRAEAFADAVRRWWSVEALRLLTAARHLLPAAPRVAANLYSEAAFAALAVRASHESLLFGKKWLGPKLRRLDDRAALDLYRLALMLPGGAEDEVRARCARLDRAVAATGALAQAGSGLQVRWWLAAGARVNRFADCVLLWQGKAGYQFPRRHAAEAWQPGQAIGVLPDGGDDGGLAAALFKDGLTWPGLAAGQGGQA
jgi:hypothetical protein